MKSQSFTNLFLLSSGLTRFNRSSSESETVAGGGIKDDDDVGEDEGKAVKSVEWVGAPLLAPGKVVFLYQKNGSYKACLGNHRMSTMRTLFLSVNRKAKDHSLESYIAAIRTLRSTRCTNNDSTGSILPLQASLSIATYTKQFAQLSYKQTTSGGCDGLLDREPYRHFGLRPVAQRAPPEYRPASYSSDVNVHLDAEEHGSQYGSRSSVESTTTSTIATTTVAAVPSPSSFVSMKNFTRCEVCALDCSWAYVTHSDSTRAMVTHNCRACGFIVCSVCAPAGESIPGDGVNKFEVLSDLRISLPALGMIVRQRVCIPCYLDCYHL